MNEPKKASEVLLEMDQKIDLLLGMVRALDLNMKIISNKLNQQNIAMPKAEAKPMVFAETNITPKSDLLPIQGTPNNEMTFADISRRGRRNDIDEAAIQKPAEVLIKPQEEVVFKEYFEDKNVPFTKDTLIPVSQRVEDSNGKVIFLASVEVKNIKTNKITKTKTNGKGKWNLPLEIGKYEVLLSKRQASDKEKKETKITINVDGSKVPYEIEAIRFK